MSVEHEATTRTLDTERLGQERNDPFLANLGTCKQCCLRAHRETHADFGCNEANCQNDGAGTSAIYLRHESSYRISEGIQISPDRRCIELSKHIKYQAEITPCDEKRANRRRGPLH